MSSRRATPTGPPSPGDLLRQQYKDLKSRAPKPSEVVHYAESCRTFNRSGSGIKGAGRVFSDEVNDFIRETLTLANGSINAGRFGDAEAYLNAVREALNTSRCRKPEIEIPRPVVQEVSRQPPPPRRRVPLSLAHFRGSDQPIRPEDLRTNIRAEAIFEEEGDDRRVRAVFDWNNQTYVVLGNSIHPLVSGTFLDSLALQSKRPFGEIVSDLRNEGILGRYLKEGFRLDDLDLSGV